MTNLLGAEQWSWLSELVEMTRTFFDFELRFTLTCTSSYSSFAFNLFRWKIFSLICDLLLLRVKHDCWQTSLMTSAIKVAMEMKILISISFLTWRLPVRPQICNALGHENYPALVKQEKNLESRNFLLFPLWSSEFKAGNFILFLKVRLVLVMHWATFKKFHWEPWTEQRLILIKSTSRWLGLQLTHDLKLTWPQIET